MNFLAHSNTYLPFGARRDEQGEQAEDKVLWAQITGTPGDDTLNGTVDADTIDGGDGNDTINGNGGDDLIYDGAGNDVVNGGDGADTIYNGNGNDILRGGAGNDTFYSNANGASSDEVYGEGGDDRFRLSAFHGDLLVDGGAGHDLMILGIGIFGFAEGTLNTYTVAAGIGNDALLLGSGGNTFTSGTGEVDLSQSDLNLVNMGAGDDIVRLLRGSTSLTLGDGQDRLWIDESLFVLLTDYTPGVDEIVSLTFLGNLWDGRSNPFAQGVLRLVQRGDDAVLQRKGLINGTDEMFFDFVRFENTNVANLTSNDFGGWNPSGGTSPGRVLNGTAGDELILTDTIGNYVGPLVGSVGNDTVNALGGNDQILTYEGNDTIYAGSGNDFVLSGGGDDYVDLGDGDDEVRDDGGSDTLLGGLGRDKFVLSLLFSGHTVARGGDGDDELLVLNIANSNRTALGTATLYGEAGNDLILFGSDVINDPVNYTQPALTIFAGSGDDTIRVYGVSRLATATLGSGFDVIDLAYFYSGDKLALTVTDFNVAQDRINLFSYIDLYGLTNTTNNANLFATGHYRIARSGANTVLQIDRDGGGDSYVTVVVLQNVDAATLSAANFTATLSDYSVGNMAPNGSIPTLASVPTEGPDVLSGTNGADTIDGLGGNDMIDGLAGADTLFGNTGNDELIGGGGNDTLDGGVGADTMRGGAGNDSFYVDNGGDVVVEEPGSGLDTVIASITYSLAENVENLVLEGGRIDGTGNGANNTITGTDVANVLAGNAGADVLYGGGGSDQLYGGRGADVLYGEGGADFMVGGKDDDLLSGGGGTDKLIGGLGADTFIYETLSDVGQSQSASDIIADFDHAEGDLIDLSAIDADSTIAGNQGFTFIGNAAFSGTAGELRYFQGATRTIVEMDTDGDGAADAFLRLDGLIDLVAGDFVLGANSGFGKDAIPLAGPGAETVLGIDAAVFA